MVYRSQSFQTINESGKTAHVAISTYCNTITTVFMSGTDNAFVMTVMEAGMLHTVIIKRQPDDKHCIKFK